MEDNYNKIALSWYKNAYKKRLLSNKSIHKKEYQIFLKNTIFSKLPQSYEKQFQVISNKTFNYAKDTINKKVNRSYKSNAITNITFELQKLELEKTLKFALLNDIISCNQDSTREFVEMLEIFLHENNLQDYIAPTKLKQTQGQN